MALTAAEIALIGSTTIDHIIRNKPIDQIAHEKPLLHCLNATKTNFPAAKEFIQENIRTNYGSIFQWVKGSGVVNYNHRNTVTQAFYGWGGAHDGFSLSEDELASNGVTIHEGKKGGGTAAEKEQLVNLLTEQTESLMEGFKESLDFQMHLDGTQSVDAVAGLDHLVALNPALGVVGGVSRVTNIFWRNHVATAIAQINLLNTMEQLWRACTRNGGKPNKILAGGVFIDAYRAAASANNRVIVQNGNQGSVEGGTNELTFKGVPIVWDPTFDDLDAQLAPATPWANRCYFLNTKHIKLRPMSGQDMVTRNPTRPHNQYVEYWAVTWKGGLTMNRANAHAVLSV
ncbi:MAG: phage major capsid protein [Ghiorsea sp.]